MTDDKKLKDEQVKDVTGGGFKDIGKWFKANIVGSEQTVGVVNPNKSKPK